MNKEKLNINLPLTRNDWIEGEDGRKTKKMFLSIADTQVTLQTDDGQKVGMFGASIGGTLEFRTYDEDGNIDMEYYVSAKEIWNAFSKAAGRKDLMIGK